MAAMTIKKGDVAKAQGELQKMRGSLQGWLKYRTINDQVIAGTVITKVPTAQAAQIIQRYRDPAVEQSLADRLHAVLEAALPDAALPNPDLRSNPQAAVQLAKLALDPQLPQRAASTSNAAMAMGSWWASWPVIVVGGLAIVAVIAIRSYAEIAKDKEHYACIKAGACTDYGFWLKAAAVVGLAWFAWEKAGVGDAVKRRVGGHGTSGHAKALPNGRKL